MLELSYICQVCKKKFTHSGKMEFENHDGRCPYCGSKNVKQGVLLNIFKFLCGGGG